MLSDNVREIAEWHRMEAMRVQAESVNRPGQLTADRLAAAAEADLHGRFGITLDQAASLLAKDE